MFHSGKYREIPRYFLVISPSGTSLDLRVIKTKRNIFFMNFRFWIQVSLRMFSLIWTKIVINLCKLKFLMRLKENLTWNSFQFQFALFVMNVLNLDLIVSVLFKLNFFLTRKFLLRSLCLSPQKVAVNSFSCLSVLGRLSYWDR